jgi:acetyl-CoA acyltransferase
MQNAVIVDCLRTAVGKAPRGTLRDTRPDDLAATVIGALMDRHPQISRDEVEDVILGCATPEGEQGMNVARIAALRSGLPDMTPGVTVNRFCASGLEAIALAADRIRGNGADLIIAGGVESMSKRAFAAGLIPNPHLVEHLPTIYMSMGLTAEQVQRRFRVSREDQDEFAYTSHRKAVAAQQEGRFQEEIVPVEVRRRELKDGEVFETESRFVVDEGPRADTSMEALSKLKPVFHASGTVTAGNASQTSDGAAAAIVMSEDKAAVLGIKPMGRLLSYAVAGVPPEIMGIGPVVAIPKALALAGLKLEDIGLIELNEAFAVQALAVIRRAGLNPERVNVNGGAIALGHPLGCTGAKLTATLLREMRRRDVRYGMVTMCVGGGQGAAGIFELV